jgi:hypothetical protein
VGGAGRRAEEVGADDEPPARVAGADDAVESPARRPAGSGLSARLEPGVPSWRFARRRRVAERPASRVASPALLRETGGLASSADVSGRLGSAPDPGSGDDDEGRVSGGTGTVYLP